MMTHNTWNQPIGQFLQQAASSSPTPGGGSVAALVAALGAAMTAMVSHLSTGEKYAQHQPQIVQVIADMQSLDQTCEQLLQEDITAFNQYMTAIKLPKSNEVESAARQHAIHEATIGAIEVPFALIDACRNGLQNASLIVHVGNKQVISDLGISALLFEAAAQSARLTVEMNLSSLKESNLNKQYRSRLAVLMEEITQLKQEILQVVNTMIQKKG